MSDKKLQKFTKQITQNPAEPARKNINRIKKESEESDNPIKEEKKEEK